MGADAVHDYARPILVRCERMIASPTAKTKTNAKGQLVSWVRLG